MSTLGLMARPEESQPLTQSDNARLYEPDFAIDLREYLQILWRQKKVICSILAVIMALAFIYLSSLSPRYTAFSLVEINPRQTQIVDFESILTGLPANNETIQTEIKIMQSRRLARRAIVHLQLDRSSELNPVLRSKGLVASWREWLAAWLTEEAIGPQSEQATETVSEAGEPQAFAESQGIFDRLMLNLAGAISPTTDSSATVEDRINQEIEWTVDAFLGKLTVVPVGRSRVVRISFESIDPKIASAVANAVADFYIVAQLEAKFEATKRAITWLNERVEELREEVTDKERSIEEFRAKSGLLMGGRQTTLSSEQVSELNAQHVVELARLAGAQARLRQANQLLKSTSPSGIESAVDVLRSGLVTDLRRSESVLERRIAELSEEYGNRHPSMINARAELNDLRSKIKVEIDRVFQGLRNEVAVAQARAASLKRSLEEAKTEVAQSNQLEVGLRALERDANASRILLESLLQRTKEAASHMTFQQPDANVISYAAQPRGPSFPRKRLTLFLAFLGALGLAVPFAIILEKMDRGFRSAEQISRYTNVRPLGLLPRVSKRAAVGKAPHEYILAKPGSTFAEGIRTLYTNVLLSDVAVRPRVILVTSALPGEGKTAVALSLARLMAMAGHRVIIVDCDLRDPDVHKRLGMERGPGLVDYLSSGVAIEDVIKVDQDSGAHILAVGSEIRCSPDLLDSAQMQKLLRSLAKKYDLVILDSAPLLAVSDTLFVSRLADKTVFLIRWAQTSRAAATMGLQQILEAQADVAGVLLTMVDVEANAQYGYGDSGIYRGALKKYYTE